MKKTRFLTGALALALAGFSALLLRESVPATPALDRGTAQPLGLREDPATSAPLPTQPGTSAAVGSSAPTASRAPTTSDTSTPAPPNRARGLLLTVWVDGERTSDPQVRFRAEQKGRWILATVACGHAILPIDPAGDEIFEIQVLDSTGAPLVVGFADELEGWSWLRDSLYLRGAEAPWRYSNEGRDISETQLELYAFSARPIFGVVRDQEGQPASGAEVNVRGRSTRTDSQGRYSLVLPTEPASWWASVHARDAAGAFGSASIESWSEFVGSKALGQSRVDVDLSRSLTLRGSVKDAGGRALPALVEVEGCEPVTCSPDGSFQVREIKPDPALRLPRAQLRVRVTCPGYVPHERNLTLRTGSLQDFALARLRSLSGRVVDESGNPLEGVLLTASDDPRADLLCRDSYVTGEALKSARTDSDGTFEFEAPASSSFLGAALAGRPLVVWSLGRNWKGGELALVLPEGQSLTGLLVDAEGRPQPGCTLSATLSEALPHQTLPHVASAGQQVEKLPAVLALARTDDQGSFVINVPRGRYDLQVGAPSARRAPLARGVNAGDPPLRLVHSAQEFARVRVRVASNSGVRIECEVRASMASEPYRWPRTSVEGTLVLWFDQAGPTKLWVTAPGHLPLLQEVFVELNAETVLDLTLIRGGGSVQVRLPDREPFGGFWISYRDPAGGPLLKVYTGDSKGALKLTGITPGLLSLTATFVDDDLTSAPYSAIYPEVGPLEVVIHEGVARDVEFALPD